MHAKKLKDAQNKAAQAELNAKTLQSRAIACEKLAMQSQSLMKTFVVDKQSLSLGTHDTSVKKTASLVKAAPSVKAVKAAMNVVKAAPSVNAVKAAPSV